MRPCLTHTTATAAWLRVVGQRYREFCLELRRRPACGQRLKVILHADAWRMLLRPEAGSQGVVRIGYRVFRSTRFTAATDGIIARDQDSRGLGAPRRYQHGSDKLQMLAAMVTADKIT